MKRLNRWYGYRHVNGTIHPKRYFDRQDIVEAEQSDFVEKVTGPFEASGVREARVICEQRLGSNDNV